MFLLAVILMASRLPAQSPPAKAGPEVITTAVDFWALSEAEKQKIHPVRFEILVYYYDPYWQLIWGENNGAGSFLPVRGEPLPIKPGQRVIIEGNVQPARGILRNEVTVTVLQENALPAPKPSYRRLADSPQLEAQWVSLEGYVCQQQEVDEHHIEYQVLSEGRLVSVRLLVKGTDAVPQLVNTRVRINGVYVSTLDVTRKLLHIDLWVPRMTDFTTLGDLAQDPRFQLPRTPLDQLPNEGQKEWVRVEGEVRGFDSGQSLTIRDDSGQLVIQTPQPGNLKTGDRVEVVGRPSGAGLEQTLAEAHFRPLAYRSSQGKDAVAGGTPRITLRVVEQVMELPLSEVARGYYVTLRGIVTWSDPRVNFFYLQDGTGGICVRVEDGSSTPSSNDAVEIHGVTQPGRYAPEIHRQEQFSLGPLGMPPARLVTLEQVMTGAEEAHRVELRGYVRQVVAEAPWSRLDLTTSSGEFSAYLPPDPKLDDLTGAMVRITGVCAAEANDLRQLTGIRLWTAGRAAVTVEEQALNDPFDAPRQTISGLNQFSGIVTRNHRVTVKGFVQLQVPGRYLLLQDGEAGLMVFSRETEPRALGAQVEVSGFPGREGSRVVLREAITRASASGGARLPLPRSSVAEIKPDLDGRLVQLRGVLGEVIGQRQGVRLSLQSAGTQFDALLGANAGWQAPANGSLLELTGVYLLEFDEYHRPHGFRLELRTPGDVRVLATPSWWTLSRALAMAAGLGFCIVLGIVWVAMLRRRVRQQTEQLRQHLDKEMRMQAELEHSSRLDSLGVLAGGIAHDFNNLLTAIMGNLGLMRMEEAAMPLVGSLVDNAERATKRASDITQQLLTFAKGGDPVRTAVDLPEIIKEAADFVRLGSNVKVEFDIEPGLPAANVDAGQMSRVVHNLVLNAVQAMPEGGLVRMTLRARALETGEIPPLAAGRYLRLTLADNGPGIPPERLPRIFDPYFSTKVKGSGLGLATAYSIIKKHQGHITVESTLGRGTTFHLWLPTANGRQAGKPTAAGSIAPFATAKVLFMDDEDAVCHVANAMLKYRGHNATVVHDGVAALKAFSEARAMGQPFDLVILDLTVPGGMGGRDAVVELRRIDPAVRVIASSGYSQDPVMANYLEYGFIAVLPKPYTPEGFNRVINQVLQQPD